mgnify:FL=1
MNGIKLGKCDALKKYQYPVELLFKILFLIYGTISFCSFTYGTKPISYIMWATFAAGGVSLLCRVARFRDYIKTPGLIASILFLMSFAVSAFLNRQYGIKDNFVQLVLLGLYFAAVYYQDFSRDRESLYKEFKAVAWVYITLISICAIWGIALLFMNYDKVEYRGEDNYAVIRGFVWGRLYGVYLDPNRGSVMGVVASILLFRFFTQYKNKAVKALCIILILPQITFIALSDSRTGQVALCLSALCGGIVYALNKENRKSAKQTAMSVCATVLAAAILFAIPTGIKKVYNKSAEIISENAVSEGKPAEAPNLLERNYDLKEDPSNKRFSIWKSGFEIWKNETKNMLFGTSLYGIRPYAYDKLPDTFIINNNQTNFKQFHNEFITSLVSQGVVGLVCMLSFVAAVLFYVFRRLSLVPAKDASLVAALIACLVASACSAMLQLGMFYGFSQGEIVFWIMLDYLIGFLPKETKAAQERKES